MLRFGERVVKWRIPIFIICLLLLIPSAVGFVATRINYDILYYLPDDIETMEGQDILMEDFGKGAYAMFVAEGMEAKDVSALREKIVAIPHVADVIWYDSVADLSIPQELLPDKIYDFYNSDNATLMAIFFDTTTSADETMDAIQEIRNISGEQCFLSGMSAIVTDTKLMVEQELPISVKITYELDGVISGAMFDNEKVSNLTVTNGKAINDGEHSIVVGMALPGLSESLGLDTLEIDGEPVDIDIPESVEIEADVTDFSLLTTITLADNNILKNVDTDENGEFSLDSLKDSINELTDAATQLVDGADQLAGGAGTLYDGTVTLKDGTAALLDGAGQLYDGTVTLKDGTGELLDGAKQLLDGAEELRDGMKKFDEEGIQKLADLLNADIGGVVDRFKALRDYANEYTSFSGSAEDVDTGVKFLIRTDSIGE